MKHSQVFGIIPICTGCGNHPAEIEFYRSMAEAEGVSARHVIENSEPTYNFKNGHFLCPECYIKAGSPSTYDGWIAP